MTPDFFSPVFYKIRQGVSMVSYWLYVAIDATQNTGKKTSKMVDLIISEVLTPRLPFYLTKIIPQAIVST